MMGRISQDQGQLFYSFNLEAVVPDDHLVRAVARVLDLSWVRAELAPHYSHTGRPSIDPVLMIRMLIVGYIFAIRSERALCREVQLNLAYRWFCGLGIEDDIPDHSAFSRARNARFRDSDIFRHVFERVVGTCIAAGLVGGEGFAVDASLIQADANKRRSIPGAEWNKDIDPEQAHRAVKEYLATLDDPAYGAASPNGSRRIPPMAQPPTSTGWSTSRGSHRMSRSSTSRSATTGHSIGKTSRSTRSVTFTSARRARVSRRRAGWSTMGRRHCFTSRACSTVVSVHSGRDAVQGRLLGGSRVVSTRRPGTLLVGWPRQRHSSNHAAIARRSRCCSHTSSAFCGLVDCAFAVPPARSSSSRWRRLHRTFAGWRCWSHGLRQPRQPRVLHEFLRGIRGFLLEFKIVSRGRRYRRSCRSKAAHGTLSKFVLACRVGSQATFTTKSALLGPRSNTDGSLRFGAKRTSAVERTDLVRVAQLHGSFCGLASLLGVSIWNNSTIFDCRRTIPPPGPFRDPFSAVKSLLPKRAILAF